MNIICQVCIIRCVCRQTCATSRIRHLHIQKLSCMYVCMYVCKLVIVFAGLNPKAFMEMTEGKKRCLPLLGFVLAKSVEGFTLTTILGSNSFWGKIPKQAGLTGLGCVLTFRCATSELSAVAAGCFYIRLISAMWCLFSNGCVPCTQQCLLLCSSYFFRRCFMCLRPLHRSLMEKCVCVPACLHPVHHNLANTIKIVVP